MPGSEWCPRIVVGGGLCMPRKPCVRRRVREGLLDRCRRFGGRLGTPAVAAP